MASPKTNARTLRHLQSVLNNPSISCDVTEEWLKLLTSRDDPIYNNAKWCQEAIISRWEVKISVPSSRSRTNHDNEHGLLPR